VTQPSEIAESEGEPVAAIPPSISELCEAYKEARGAILRDSSGLEQEIGKAALRVEATHTYRELTTTARSLTGRDLAPLREYVENLTGGERIEARTLDIHSAH
jgi:hypothetical protein